MNASMLRAIALTLLAWAPFLPSKLAADEVPPWSQPMKQVHARFAGAPRTLALFGDSISVSMAFWAPLRGEPKGMSPETAAAHDRVKEYLADECWTGWRGPEFGNEGRMTIRWAHENVDKWLAKLKPEAAIIMFGSNDLGELEVAEFEQKTTEVVDRCLAAGTVVLLTTLPPRSGLLEKSKQFAEAVRRVAKEKQVPLIDYQAEILKRRPDDWDGTLAKFKDVPGSEYEVPTLVCRDGVHPSNPKAHQEFSQESLNKNGFLLRNYLTLMAYANVIDRVLAERGQAVARAVRPARFPHRIWAACDFEGQTPDYAWFGPPEKTNILQYPGNTTALGAQPKSGGASAALKTGINPVPGPMMGKVNKLYLRYFLRGTTEATFQHFSLTSEDNNHVRVSGLTAGKWSEASINFSRDAQRNDGTPGVPFKQGERMDDFQLYVGKPGDGNAYEVLIDDVIFYCEDPALPPEDEPFPNRVIFLAAFDTGIDAKSKPKYWPGEFDILTPAKGAPAGSYWGVARAVPRRDAKGKWIRLQIAPPRPVGEHTKLRLRYHLSGATALTAQIFDATDQDNRHIRVNGLKPDRWETLYLNFATDGKRNDGSSTPFAAGHLVDDLFFFVEPEGDKEVDLYVDEVVLYDAVR
ncbi:MAG TPA: SGNH/GDSL hydrolase family protein [Pirellulaceae bacterium]|nr:SGNH/GDSL hydrolase family protein [Pirellulaceae bacterium]